MTSVPPPTADPVPGSDALGNGPPGSVLLHAELARTGFSDWPTVNQWATAATRKVSTHPSVGLFRGAPAVAFALNCADRAAYASAVTILDQHIGRVVTRRLADAHDRIERADLPALREYDLMSGLTGLGAYLLHRGRHPDKLRDVLTYLVRLTRPLLLDGVPVPGWWTGHGPKDIQSPDWVGGHGNLGMAHGITGPMALLSIAMRRGVLVPGQPEAIDRVCAWLDRWRCGTQAPWWPAMISLAEWRTGHTRARHPHRPSWCYGVPGIARAIQLAGLALADHHRQQLATAALAATVSDNLRLNHITDASLCHGWAGLALSVWRMAADSTDPHQLTDHLPHLLQRLDHHIQDNPTHDDGFLEGTAGTQIARHTIRSGQPPMSRWDACLLLDG